MNMVDKHKILARNEEVLRSAPHPVQSKLNAAQLKAIYRAPKTREQLRTDDAQRQAMFRSRMPRWVTLKITALASVLLVALLTYLMSVQTMWTAGGESVLGGLTGVSFSFALLVVLGFAYFFAYGYFDRIFTLAGRSQPVFFSGYAGILIVSLAVGILAAKVLDWGGLYMWIIPTITIHVLLLCGFLVLILRHARDVDV